jgi:tRNA pseudouridine13 synthase
MHMPGSLSWKFLRYTDPDHQLAQADEDVLLGYPPLPEDPEGKSLALQIELTLGSSTYATMALRELLKADTSSESQKALTDEMTSREGAASSANKEEDVVAPSAEEVKMEVDAA